MWVKPMDENVLVSITVSRKKGEIVYKVDCAKDAGAIDEVFIPEVTVVFADILRLNPLTSNGRMVCPIPSSPSR